MKSLRQYVQTTSLTVGNRMNSQDGQNTGDDRPSGAIAARFEANAILHWVSVYRRLCRGLSTPSEGEAPSKRRQEPFLIPGVVYIVTGKSLKVSNGAV